MRTFRALAVLSACALLSACGPSSSDIARAVGRNDVSDMSCTAAVGQPASRDGIRVGKLPTGRTERARLEIGV